MYWILLPLLLSSLFASTVERAFTLFRNGEWMGAASVLDQAYAEDRGLFAANNLHYLRGRLAESQMDWARARSEFTKIPAENSLYPLAAWHAARASARLQDDPAAETFLNSLPSRFPTEMKMQIAREASPALALKIYQGISTRDARLERAKILGDRVSLWRLLRERKDDDVALQSAHLVAASASTPREQLDVADTYAAHRQFDDALPFYQSAAQQQAFAAETRYQIARIHFLRQDYRTALETYQEIARDFAGTDWEKDSDYQIASCYWRLGEYRNSEKAYLRYIAKYGSRGMEEGAVRNLVDVYRVLGENQKALTWLDRTLGRPISAPNRQVLLFTKAKILYSEKRYNSALPIFRQLARSRLRSAPGNTTKDEALYFQALCLSKTGNKRAAEAVWRDLAAEPLSYYGQKSAERLGKTKTQSHGTVCEPLRDPTLVRVEQSLEVLRRPLRSETDATPDPVLELAFLQLWDEASVWMERTQSRPNPRTAAELAYMASRYHRSIVHADRMRRSEASTFALLYPAGFRQLVCDAAVKYGVDPLWLHAIIWQESKYNPNARSAASARGLMQFIPETANAAGAAIGIPELPLDRLYDPAISIELGAYHWASLMEKLKSPEMALAAYNGGLDNARRWKAKWADSDDELFVADIGFVETKRYVMAVFGARAAYEFVGRLPENR